MTGEPRSLAVLLRWLQWELDEAAFEIGAGRYDRQQRNDLAAKMSELAKVLRENPDTASIIDQDL